MAGIYLHIPFCRKKCGYCNFFSIASQRHQSAFADALCLEIAFRKDLLGNQPIDTIYFGGGTPSMLEMPLMEKIFSHLHHSFTISSLAEITLEANPDDISIEKLSLWKKMGVNRISIGIQSYDQKDLDFLDRAHDRKQALQAPELCYRAGIDQLSLDLIYGIPGQDNDSWKSNLDIVMETGAGHISAYALTLEEKTPYFRKVSDKSKAAPDGDQAFRQFLILNETATARGFEHYEVSNLAKPGLYSRHNTAYWQGLPYLGLGPSAHSFDGRKRSWNVSRLGKYIQTVTENKAVEDEEVLQGKDYLNEYLMTSLRTMWGCSKARVEELSDQETLKNINTDIQRFIDLSWLRDYDDRWVLTTEGLFHADGIAASLFSI